MCGCGRKRSNKRLRSTGRAKPVRNNVNPPADNNVRIQALKASVEQNDQNKTQDDIHQERKRRNQIVRRTLRGGS